MRIVGYQSGRHDVSYCVLENGVPVIHEELERLLRVKEVGGDGLGVYFQRMGDEQSVDHFTFGNPNNQLQIQNEDPKSQALMNNALSKSSGKHWIIGHHKSHAANAFFSSNYDDALIFTKDGGGVEDD